MDERQRVAEERATADLVVENGRIYCSHRRDFLERDVAIVGDRIAALLEDADPVVDEETTVISADDRVVLPGLIDAHTHADMRVTPERAAPHLLASGTTSVVSETSALGVPFGARGVETLLERAEDLPLSVYYCLPPQSLADTFAPSDDGRDGGNGTGPDLEAEVDALASLLERDRIVAVGEIDWIHVVGRDSPIHRLCERAREAGAAIVGHGAGCRGDSMRSFATVVDNDHEAISAEGVRERAEHGVHVVGRCGSNRDDLDALAEAFSDLSPASVSLSTDGVWPPDLLEGYGMADVVRRAIEAGISAPDAIDAASRNPAEHFGLEGRGVVEPRAYADLAIVDDLESMAVETVVVEGAVVVEDGEPLEAARFAERAEPYPDYVYESVSIPADLERDRFTAPLEAAPGVTVRAMEVGRGLVTTETTVEPAVEGDRLVPAPEEDVVTATLLATEPDTDRSFTGFLAGFGLEEGAVATTATWEARGLATVAADPDDAVVATERVAELGGGFAVARDGEVVAEVAMPIAGGAADAPVGAVVADLEAAERATRDAGVDVDAPLLVLQTLTFVGVPTLKLTASGYADILGRSLVGLEPEPDSESE
ncbi:adenine deaminase C-terminal domain-containing protein [Natrialbaceae archaeon GCM10025810]|uniref:adenine deaminase C-terminal domain-containing protein n=1 Tax=Halovalidus salilacus TaxID=3075124 RepID=UPI0036090DBF